MRRKTSPVQYLSLQYSLAQGQAWSLNLPLTLRLILASYKVFVAFVFQQLEYIGEVQLSRAARFSPGWDLCHLHMSWRQM